jgi:hypothetical protein
MPTHRRCPRLSVASTRLAVDIRGLRTDLDM